MINENATFSVIIKSVTLDPIVKDAITIIFFYFNMFLFIDIINC